MRRALRWARRLVGLALLGLAARWAIRAMQRHELEHTVAYPNDYGLRLSPLSRDETRDALERERHAAAVVLEAMGQIDPGDRIGLELARQARTIAGLQRSADPPIVAPAGTWAGDPA